jgi:hypothetical protein
MPDLSMCYDNDCPARFDCYRHRASGTRPSSFWQAYSVFPREKKAEQCDEFWPLRIVPRRVRERRQ